MSVIPSVALSELMASRVGSVDPSKFPDEVFDLYSIPAFDRGAPEVAIGSSIGSAKQIVRPGDVLLSKIVPHIRRSWVVGGDRGSRLIASGEWIVFRSDRIDQAYLRHVLVGDPFHSQFMQTVSGVGGSLLRARPAQVAKITVPLPPLPEQRRIAAILEQADALRAKRREALAQLDSLTQSIFIEMFGDPLSPQQRWPQSTFGDTVSHLVYGPRFYNDSYSEEGARIVRITDLDNLGQLSFANMPRMALSDSDVRKYALTEGDLIFARSGSVGKSAVFPRDAPICVAGAYFIVMRFKSVVLPEFVRSVLAAESVQMHIQGHSRQAIQPNFSGPAIRSLPLPLPPMTVQTEFVSRLEQVKSVRVLHMSALDELNTLFTSLQHRAFRGEL